MKCKYCGEEFEAKRSTAKFCSVKCKLAYHRKNVNTSDDTVKGLSVSDKSENDTVKPVSVSKSVSVSDSVSSMTREQLQTRINYGYTGNAWCRSPEYKELLRRLETMTIEELELEGYDVPNWKRKGDPCPIVV